MKCDKCQKEICVTIGDNYEWLKLMNYFEHELNEGEITNATWESMTNALMIFKPGDD